MNIRQNSDPQIKSRSQKVIPVILKAAIMTGGTTFGLNADTRSSL